MTISQDQVRPSGNAPATAAPPPSQPEAAGVGFFSQESERLCVAVMLNASREELHHSLMSLLSAEDFYIDQHQTIWRLIGALRDGGLSADPASLLDRAATSREFVGGAQYILEAANDSFARVCSNDAVVAAANRVKGFAITRRLQRCLTQGQALCSTGQDADSVMSFIEDQLTDLRRASASSRTGPVHASVHYESVLARIQAAADGETPTDCVSTGYEQLDLLLNGGVQREQVLVIAGRPGMGKSSFAGAIEQIVSTRGHPTLTFSLEMPGQQQAGRSISRHARIPFSNIRTGQLRDHEFSPLIETVETLSRAPSYIDDTPGLKLSELRSRAREFISKHPGAVIFIDYLQQLVGQHKDERNNVTEASKTALQLARELKCPVVALAQLNRSVEQRANKRPMMADLRESGQIEQDAAVIVFLYRDEHYNPDTKDPGITECIIAKNRDNATETVKFSHQLSIGRYEELGRFQSEE